MSFLRPKNIPAVLMFAVLMAAAFFPGANAWALSKSEMSRVESLLAALGDQKDLIFIRNGKDYSSEQAVKHLKRKLAQTSDKLKTAEEFIDNVASSSSISGKPYQVRYPDSTVENSSTYFHRLLQESSQP